MKQRGLIVLATIVIVGLNLIPAAGARGAGTSVAPASPDADTNRASVEAFDALPMAFEPNVGQTDARVRYVARGRGYAVFVTGEEVVLSLACAREPSDSLASGRLPATATDQREPAGDALRITFAGARPGAVVAERALPGKSAYLIGGDESRWRRDVPTFAAVRYTGMYEGVDAVLYGNARRLEYDLRVAPGADPSQIRVRFEGQRAADVDENGDLVLRLSGGEVRHRRAVVFQEDGASRHPVAARYVLRGEGEVGVELGEYDRTKPLVVDPVLEYADYLGGSTSRDDAYAVAVDASGATYVAGETQSTDFPATPGAFGGTAGGDLDAFVVKVAANGASVVYSTYLGSAGSEGAYGVAVDTSGAAVVVGYAFTPNATFPTTPGAYDRTWNGHSDAFVTKLAPDGTSLLFSTLVGGDWEDTAVAVAVDASGAVYVAGRTFPVEQSSVTPYPTTAGTYDRLARQSNGFVTKLNATGSALAYSTFVGGVGEGTGLALAPNGSVLVCGFTSDAAFRTTPGAFDTTFNGTPSSARDAFVLRLNAAGSAAVYATFLGGAAIDYANAVAADASGAAYVVGATQSADFPATPGAFDTALSGPGDGFATKLTPDGSALAYSTFVGGSVDDYPYAIAVDASGCGYVVGATGSPDFPVTAGAFDTTANGSLDGFVTKLAANGQALLYATYLGGVRDERAWAVAVDASGAAHVAGSTGSPDYPIQGGPPAGTRDSADVFLATLAPSGGALVYSTTLGGISSPFGDSGEVVFDVAVDAAGAAYVTGSTNQLNFPATPGAFDTFDGDDDVFVSKLSPDGSALVYSTFLGGHGSDAGFAIAVDAAGAAFVAGYTQSPDLAVTAGAFDTSINGVQDGFVAELAPSGGSLAYATYLGGLADEMVRDLAIDVSGAVFVIGRTSATDFPTTPGAFDTTPLPEDVFVTKFAPGGGSLVYSTMLGGSSIDEGYGIAVDAAGSAYVTGVTYSSDFPLTPGAIDTTLGDAIGAHDAFVARLNATGTALVYATFVGGAGGEVGRGIAVDAAGNAFVAGNTDSTDFPTTPGAFDRTPNGQLDVFLAALNPTGTSLLYGTYLGGADYDETYGMCLAPDGRVYLTGTTSSIGFPVTPDALDVTGDPDGVAFLTAFDATGGLAYSTFFGGPRGAYGNAVVGGPDGEVVFAGVLVDAAVATTGFGHPDLSNLFVAKLRPPKAGSADSDTPGVYVASTGAWFLRNSNSPGGADMAFTYGAGGAGLVPLVGDWNGDGTDTPGLYNPATGAFFLENTNAGGGADVVFTFGAGGAGLVALAGDWDGDGADSVGLYAPATGAFFLKNANAPGPADVVFSFGPGGAGIAPIAGDWNGDGADTVGVYVSGTKAFFLRNANAPGAADLAFSYGPPSVTPLRGDWNGDGIDTVGVYASGTGAWFLRNRNSPGGADLTFSYGPPNVVPLAGDWDGQ